MHDHHSEYKCGDQEYIGDEHVYWTLNYAKES